MLKILLFPFLLISNALAQEVSEDSLNILPVQKLSIPSNHGRILIYSPFCMRSIVIKLVPIMEELADRGHTITAVIPHLADYSHENITVIDVTGAAEEPLHWMATQALDAAVNSGPQYILDKMALRDTLAETTAKTNKIALENKLFRKQIDEHAFDAVIVYNSLPNEVGVYLAHRMKAKLILYCTAHGPNLYAQWSVGQPFNAAYQSFVGFASTRVLTFMERVANVVCSFYFFVTYRHFTTYEVEVLLEKYFPGEERVNILELERSITNLVLFSGHELVDGARPMAPNMQYLGTIHCRPPKVLPVDLQSFFDKSGDDGVILVSFGSYILGKNMKESVLQVLLKVFGQLDQSILWKWENDTMEGQPNNVKLLKWVPQQNILGHPKTKLFITHAGQSSIQESLCHKKPVIAIPVGLDQEYYAKEVERMGFGKYQSYHEIEEESFLESIRETIRDPKYIQAAKSHGNVIIDQINEPLDRAIWWIEYLIRHKEEDYLRSEVHHLPTHTYFLIDVIAFLLLVTLGTLFLTWAICRKLMGYFYSSTRVRVRYLSAGSRKKK